MCQELKTSQSAAKTREGYLVTVKEAGYGGDIVMEVSFGEDKFYSNRRSGDRTK